MPAVGRRARARLPPARAAHDALRRRARSRHSDGRSDVHALHANASTGLADAAARYRRRGCGAEGPYRRAVIHRVAAPRSPLQMQSAALATYAPRVRSVRAIGPSPLSAIVSPRAQTSKGFLISVDNAKIGALDCIHSSRPDNDVRPRVRHRSPLTNRVFVRGLFFVRIFGSSSPLLENPHVA